MVEIAGRQGYGAVTLRNLVRLAGVSTRAFYEHFDDKEDCFLSTFDFVVQRAGGRIVEAQGGEREWREQLRLAFQAFAHELEERPRAARLALVESLAVGPAALDRLRQAEVMFEAMVAESFSRAPGGSAVPAIALEGIVSGVAGVSRARLLAEREKELPDPDLADILIEWALSYSCETSEDLALLDSPSAWPGVLPEFATGPTAQRPAHGDERALLLAAVSKLVASEGYHQLSAPRIRAVAGVSRRSFDSHFDGVADCFLAALEERATLALDNAARAQSGARSWEGGIHRAMVVLCANITRDPTLAKLAFVEVLAPGPEGLRCRERLMATMARLFCAAAPRAHRSGQVAAEATVGAIWGVLHRQIALGRARQLQTIAPSISFLALAPAIGASEALRAIRLEMEGDSEAGGCERQATRSLLAKAS
jgi:AcrR family transcriptional regulator